MFKIDDLYYVVIFLDGCGYVEDGREIFDDEEAAEPYNPSTKKEEGHAKKRKARVSALAEPSSSKGKGNIRNLISSMPNKKKEVFAVLDII